MTSHDFQAGRLQTITDVLRRELDQVRMPETMQEAYEMLGHVSLLYRGLEDLSEAVLLAQTAVGGEQREVAAARHGVRHEA